jgi:hypothetical protein
LIDLKLVIFFGKINKLKENDRRKVRGREIIIGGGRVINFKREVPLN